MQRLNPKIKAGFAATQVPVIIYDQRGLFLQYDKPVNFNLPPGTYEVKSGQVAALEQPVQYPLPELPVSEKHLDLDNVKIKEISTISITPKMAIDVNTGEVYKNTGWTKTLLTPQLRFCEGHEIGHFFYATQEKCDQLAEYLMLDEGFNPVQIAMASHTTLCGACQQKGPLETLFDLDIPFESAMRRINTEDRMYNVSHKAANGY